MLWGLFDAMQPSRWCRVMESIATDPETRMTVADMVYEQVKLLPDPLLVPFPFPFIDLSAAKRPVLAVTAFDSQGARVRSRRVL
jgi:hypothetical protein